ncbi:hypothetical protein LLG95_05450 [bacterium]|nr:hypothetical protein [bacterium]
MSNETITIADWMRRAPKPVAERFDAERHVTLADLYDLAQDEINRAEDGLVKHHPSTMKSLRRFADDLHAAGALEQGNGADSGEYPDDWAMNENEPAAPVMVATADPEIATESTETEPIAAMAEIPALETSNEQAPQIETESLVEPAAPVIPTVAAATELEPDSSDEGRRSSRAAAYRNQVRARLKVDFPNLALRRAEFSESLLRPLNRKFTKWADESGSEMALSLEGVLDQIGAASERTIDEFTAAFLVQTA